MSDAGRPSRLRRLLEVCLTPAPPGRLGRVGLRLLRGGRGVDPAADFRPSRSEARLSRLRQSWTPPATHRLFDTLFPVPQATAGHGREPGGWEYHDEAWDQVQQRFELRRRLAQGRSFSLPRQHQPTDGRVRCDADGAVAVDAPARGPQHWHWLHLPAEQHVWRDYVWRLTVTRHTDFRELQLAFRYVDFFNRYRFRYEAGAFHFDVVHRGRFENSRLRAGFDWPAGRSHDLEIVVRGPRFVLKVDGVVLLDASDGAERFAYGPIGVIFWEDDGATPIRVDVSNQRVTETRP